MDNSEKNQAPQGATEVPETMRLWEFWRHAAPGTLSAISGGNLNRKSNINAQWRLQVLTQAFGPVGFGWNVTEVERWTDEAAGEVSVNVKVHLRIKVAGEWSEPIEGIGGSKLCGRGKGDGINDEAWKMATTDAISVACKSLGIAADVYMGLQSHQDADQQHSSPWAGTKYDERPKNREFSPQNARPGNYTGQGVQGRETGQNWAPQGNYGPGPVRASDGAPYQAPPAGDPNYQQPQGPRQHQARVCEVADIQKGKARRLIETLAQFDYDDPEQWAVGLAWLRNEVVLRDGAEELIVRMAVEARNAAQQQAVDNARRAVS